MRNEQIRKVLETRYTHVTFVKTVKGLRSDGFTLWYVGEDMEAIFIQESWEVNQILNNLDIYEVFQEVKPSPYHDKWNTFKEAVKQGVLEPTAKVYKSTTTGKMLALLGYTS